MTTGKYKPVFPVVKKSNVLIECKQTFCEHFCMYVREWEKRRTKEKENKWYGKTLSKHYLWLYLVLFDLVEFLYKYTKVCQNIEKDAGYRSYLFDFGEKKLRLITVLILEKNRSFVCLNFTTNLGENTLDIPAHFICVKRLRGVIFPLRVDPLPSWLSIAKYEVRLYKS